MALIFTTKGMVEETILHKTTGVVDNEIEYTEWVEYREHEGGEIIHRSVHVTLKKPAVFADGVASSIG